MAHVPLGWPFPDGYPDVATNWVNANSQILRWNMFGTFLQGDGWNQPDLAKLFPTAGKDIDSHIDAIARTLLLTELGSADRKSIKNAVTRSIHWFFLQQRRCNHLTSPIKLPFHNIALLLPS